MKKFWEGKHGPLLIAEIGGNHEGDFEYAIKLTELAINSDVDYIKYQIYSANVLVNPDVDLDRYNHFKKFELTIDQYKFLADMCRNAGVGFMASVWGDELINEFDNYIDIYKIGSGDLTALPILKQIANFRKPIILSTGLSTLEEIKYVVSFIQDCEPGFFDSSNFTLLQCTSMYPIDFSEANLNVMHTLRAETGLNVGYSDHTIDNTAIEIAIDLGATVIEFHFTDDKSGKSFRDHQVSLTPNDIKSLIESIKKHKSIRGDFNKVPLKCEIETNHVDSFRRGVYLTRNIKKGHVITENDLVVLRPQKGISSIDYYKLVGKMATCNLSKYQELSFNYFKD
jgi:N-acetylneuraminate synthase/N,N'-diacetyllegionaminate synthase